MGLGSVKKVFRMGAGVRDLGSVRDKKLRTIRGFENNYYRTPLNVVRQ
jgi:chromosome condensin MukBEF MukE localization factor